MSDSNSNSNSNPNPQNGANNSSTASRPRTPYVDAVQHQQLLAGSQRQIRAQPQNLRISTDVTTSHAVPLERTRFAVQRQVSRPSTPTLVYIVTSHFISQTMSDGVRLSESDILGYQILAVFGRLEDANSYAEHECEEIDAGVRRRRTRRLQGGVSLAQEGDGIRAEAIVRVDGTVSWTVEDLGQIEVAQWVVQ